MMRYLTFLLLLALAACSQASAQSIPCYLTATSTKCFQPVEVGSGGTGDATLASNGVLYGNGTSAVQAVAVNSTATNKFLSQVSSGAPGWVTLTSGDIPTGNLTDAGTDGITVTSGTNAVVGSGTSLAQHVADTTHNGYLSSTDWNTFNVKVPATRAISTTAPLTGGGDLSADRTIAITQSGTAGNGYLSSTDWNTFNGKQAALTLGNLTDAGTDGITVTGGTGAVVGSGTSLAQHVADTTHNGYLGSTDWATFNAKVSSTRAINTTAPITGGGDLSADRTIAISAASASAAGTVSLEDSNTYAPTLGGARSVVITFKWARVGKIVSLSWAGSTGVGCAADTFHTGASSLPADITPAAERDIQVQIQDNNTIPTATGYMQFNSDGSFVILKSFASSTFTNAQNCGWYAGSGSYPVN